MFGPILFHYRFDSVEFYVARRFGLPLFDRFRLVLRYRYRSLFVHYSFDSLHRLPLPHLMTLRLHTAHCRAVGVLRLPALPPTSCDVPIFPLILPPYVRLRYLRLQALLVVFGDLLHTRTPFTSLHTPTPHYTPLHHTYGPHTHTHLLHTPFRFPI